nr:hypothetical protein [Candidatus Sigynarchaeota archaeon]
MAETSDASKAPEGTISQKEQKPAQQEPEPSRPSTAMVPAEPSVEKTVQQSPVPSTISLQAGQGPAALAAGPWQAEQKGAVPGTATAQPESNSPAILPQATQVQQAATPPQPAAAQPVAEVSQPDLAACKDVQKEITSTKVKCHGCANNIDARLPVVVIQKQKDSNNVIIKFGAQCGHGCQVILNKDLELIDHICSSFKTRGSVDDFDFDKFLEGQEELDDVLLKKQAKQAAKLVGLEDQMKIAVKKLVKPLAMLIPTTAQKKTEEMLRAEREARLREVVEIDVNIVYLRVLEFEKLAAGNTTYPIDKLCKMLKNLDKTTLVGFIRKINNDFLVTYNEDAQTVRFYNPSKPELEILSREFEKCLRFNRT